MKKGMKQLALILSVLMLITVFAGMAPVASAETAADGPVMTKIKASGKLVVGTEAQYAPYEFKDLNANFVGCDMFLAQKIADALGVELEIVDMSFDGIIPAVQAGQVDLGIAAFTNTPARAEVIDFSDLYETSLQYLVVAAKNADIYTTKEALAGLKVGAQKGTIQSQLITSALPDSQLFELDKGALAVAKFEFTAEEASFGKSVVIPKGNEDLVAVVNEVIAQVLADGSYQAAYDEAVALAAQMGV